MLGKDTKFVVLPLYTTTDVVKSKNQHVIEVQTSALIQVSLSHSPLLQRLLINWTTD